MPEIRVGEHLAHRFDRDEGTEVEPQGERAVAIRFRRRKSDAMAALAQRSPKAEIGEDISIGSDGGENNVHSVSGLLAS